MNFTDVVNLISTVGFPIACTVYLAYYVMKTNDRMYELTAENVEAVTKCADELKNLTSEIEKLEVKYRDL